MSESTSRQEAQEQRIKSLSQKYISSKQVLKQFSIMQWVLISIRLTLFVMFLIPQIVLQKYILPLMCIPLPIVKRYIQTAFNLFYLRILFLTLGFFRFQCENYRFFERESPKIMLKSGYIGIGNHKNIIDFMYYSYLLNPVFVKLILVKHNIQSLKKQQQERQKAEQQEQHQRGQYSMYKKNQQQEQQVNQKGKYSIYYAPLSYSQSLICALSSRGFDPIIVQDEKQMKKIKYRKMNMKTLVSECFQQLRGPIFILLPGIFPNQHLKIQSKVAQDIFQNQKKFLRSGVGFKIRFDKKQIFQRIHKNQFYLLLTLMSEFQINHMSSTALTFRNYAWKYTKNTYSDFIDKNLYVTQSETSKFISASYTGYVHQLKQVQQLLIAKYQREITNQAKKIN